MSIYLIILFFILIKFSKEDYSSKNNDRKLETDSEGYSNIRIHVEYKCLVTSPNRTNSNDPLSNASQ